MKPVAIAVATFYEDLANRLVTSAQATLEDADWSVDVFEVPGAFELPMAAAMLAATERYAGVVCVGAVIRGETSHYDHVCAETARGIQDVQLRTGTPCGFGVLTCDSMEQALARSGGSLRDAGRNAASAVLALLAIEQSLHQPT